MFKEQLSRVRGAVFWGVEGGFSRFQWAVFREKKAWGWFSGKRFSGSNSLEVVSRVGAVLGVETVQEWFQKAHLKSSKPETNKQL